METGQNELKGIKKILYKKYREVVPSARVEGIKYDDTKKKMLIRVIPENNRYIRMVEVTVRDYKGRDIVRKLRKKDGSFRINLKMDINKNYHMSFYVLGKDGKFIRLEKNLEEFKEDIARIKEFNKTSQEIKQEENPETPIPQRIKRSWPNSSSYAQALQNVDFSVSKKYEDLRTSKFIPNSNVKYKSLIHGAGNFGVVFKFQMKENYYAMKCFTRASQYIDTRYYEISKAIESAKLPFLIDFRYYANAVRTPSKPTEYFPVITMEWIEGQTLYNYVRVNYKDSAKMNTIARSFLQYVIDMQSKSIAHGDLSGDNILITDKMQIKIIDYDGMFVRALQSLGSEELGHESFQHPKRGKYYGPKLDNFSAIVIYLSLYALSKSPELWKYNQNDPDKMLFDINDFNSPEKSEVFLKIEKLGGKSLRLGNILKDYIKHEPDWEGVDLEKIMKMR
jgi:hypothetical protein